MAKLKKVRKYALAGMVTTGTNNDEPLFSDPSYSPDQNPKITLKQDPSKQYTFKNNLAGTSGIKSAKNTKSTNASGIISTIGSGVSAIADQNITGPADLSTISVDGVDKPVNQKGNQIRKNQNEFSSGAKAVGETISSIPLPVTQIIGTVVSTGAGVDEATKNSDGTSKSGAGRVLNNALNPVSTFSKLDSNSYNLADRGTMISDKLNWGLGEIKGADGKTINESMWGKGKAQLEKEENEKKQKAWDNYFGGNSAYMRGEYLGTDRLKSKNFATLKKGGLKLNMALLDKAQGKAKGGAIEGPGTGTSDDVKAKLKDGSFVVPTKNAHIAEMIRETVFGKGKKKANTSEGTEVRLSNGEHTFSPEETNILTQLGIDLNKLAPEAKVKLNTGGMYADGGGVRGNQNASKEREKKEKAELEARKKFLEENIDKIPDVKVRGKNPRTQAKNELASINEILRPKLRPSGPEIQPESLKIKSPIPTPQDYAAIIQGKIPTQAKTKLPVNLNLPIGTNPSNGRKVATGVSKMPTDKNYLSKNLLKLYSGNPDDNYFIADPDAEMAKQQAKEAAIEKLYGGTGNITVDEANRVVNPVVSKTKKTSPVFDQDNGLSILDLVGTGQAAFGALNLLDSKRPMFTDKYSPTGDTIEQTQRLKANQEFGFDPYTRNAILNSIRENRIIGGNVIAPDVQTSNQYKRMASVDANKAWLDFMSQDQQFKQAKTAAATDQIRANEAINRTQFQDKFAKFGLDLDAFHQIQGANADLLNSGIHNLFESQKIKRAEKARRMETDVMNKGIQISIPSGSSSDAYSKALASVPS